MFTLNNYTLSPTKSILVLSRTSKGCLLLTIAWENAVSVLSGSKENSSLVNFGEIGSVPYKLLGGNVCTSLSESSKFEVGFIKERYNTLNKQKYSIGVSFNFYVN